MNTNALTRIAGMDLSALSGPWLMAEDRIKGLHARVAGVISGGVTPQARVSSSAAVDPDDAYAIVGGVAVIKIVGVLTKYPMPDPFFDEWCGFCPALQVMASLNEAIADERVKEIAFVIDSPGGMVAGTNELAEAIAAADAIKPCRAIVSDLAASGGYYIASQCRSIACNAMGEVGCIGVYTVLWDQSKWFEMMGVTPTLVSSGGVKGIGADGKVTAEYVADQKRGVDAMYAKFIADVAKGRAHAGMTPEGAKNVGTGQTWLAVEAMGLRLIDSVASAADALSAININLSGAKSPAVTPAPQAGKNAAKSGTPKAADSGGMEISMDAKKRAYLESIGLKTDATDEQAVMFYDLLSDEKKAAADAAETAEAVEVVEVIEPTAGKAKDDNVAAGPAKITDLIAACDGDKACAADYLIASMTVEQAKAAYDGVKRANVALAEAKAETARAQYAAGGTKPLPVAGQSGTGDASSTPEAQAKSEFAKLSSAEKSSWSDENTYVAYRKREIARGV